MRQHLDQCMANGLQCIRAGLGDARAARAALAPFVTAQDGSLGHQASGSADGCRVRCSIVRVAMRLVHQAVGLGCRG